MTDATTDSAFVELALDPRLLAAIDGLGFVEPTDVQAAAIPALLEGRDVIGRARTGSGKTAAFGLPLLERVKEGGAARALVLTPTRELALQVGQALRDFAKGLPLRIVTIYGGAAYEPQLKALAAGATIVVGTPGRVIDHIERGTLDLAGLQVLVLDEADEMLRMGFVEDVEKVLAQTPASRQIALFSATMPEPLRAIARTHMREPVELSMEERPMSVDHIEQLWLRVPPRFKLDALVRVLRGVVSGSTLVFARTRSFCAQAAEALIERGIDVEALHGDLTQASRERVVARMRTGRLKIVVATDVAARGLDVEHITHVINLDMPDSVAAYVHRIGRTGRAGRAGTAISFVTPGEMHKLKQLERSLRANIGELEVPSDADIARAERKQLAAMLEQAAGGLQPEVLDWIEALAERSPHDMTDLAAAAVSLLAEHENIALGAIPAEGPPPWAKPRVRPPSEDDVFLFFPVGFKRGVRPHDLVGLLANEAQVAVSRIGRITILANKSFVGLPKSVADHVLKVLPSTTVRGTVVPVRLARERGEEERGRARTPPPRPSRKHPHKRKPHLGKRRKR